MQNDRVSLFCFPKKTQEFNLEESHTAIILIRNRGCQ